MNKTVTINISGIIFHIEEDAFNKLSKYLSTISGYFSKADGGNEIMSDIESRIAEMLQSRTSAVKQVVLMSDVDFVMDSMGKPEEFAGDTSDNTGSSERAENYDTYAGEPIKKRLYRDGDSKVLGGVCSGIGHYFGIDTVWLRIALLLMFFFAGTGLLLYIILWIAIPEAKTTAERLAMKGAKADINNISKAVKEEAEQFKKRMEKYGSEFKNMAARNAPRNSVEKIIDFIGDVLINIGRVLLKIIGVCMVIFGVLFFMGLFGSVFGMSFMTSNVEVQEWIDMVLMDGKDFYLGLLGISLFLGVPIMMLIYGGIKILFKLKYSNRWVNLSAGVLWLFGFIMCLYVGIKTGSDFSKEAKVREKIEVKPYDTLILKLNEMPVNISEVHASTEDHEDYDDEGVKITNHNHDDYMIGKHDGIKYLLGHANLNIIKSQTDRIELLIVKESNGNNKLSATGRAKNIAYKVNQIDSMIVFDNLFKAGNADKFRAQDVNVILKLPVNKVIYLDKSLLGFIYDIENTTNTYDGDMINRRWMMTEYGLKCIDCDGLISKSDYEMPVHPEVPAHPKTPAHPAIHINNNKDTKVTIDNNGVHIETDKVDK
ncbi:MAG: PspC domain-containing protein [Bacteroidota bacterium]